MKAKHKYIAFASFAFIGLFALSFSSCFFGSFLFKDNSAVLSLAVNNTIPLNEGPAIMSFSCSSEDDLVEMRNSVFSKVKYEPSFARYVNGVGGKVTTQIEGSPLSVSLIEAKTFSDGDFSSCNHSIYAVGETSFSDLGTVERSVYLPVPIAKALLPVSDKNNYASLYGSSFSVKTSNTDISYTVAGVFGYPDDKSYLSINDAISSFLIISEADMNEWHPTQAFVRFAKNATANTRAVDTLFENGYFDFDNIAFSGNGAVQLLASSEISSYSRYFSSGIQYASLVLALLLYAFIVYLICFVFKPHLLFKLLKVERPTNILLYASFFFAPCFASLALYRFMPSAVSFFGYYFYLHANSSLFTSCILVLIVLMISLFQTTTIDPALTDLLTRKETAYYEFNI